jgi:hypothetical protein
VPDAGAPEWHSVETAVAQVIGPTDVHVVNHHGSIAQHGHIVVRVTSGGDEYFVYVLDDLSEDANVTAVFGPYASAGRHRD